MIDLENGKTCMWVRRVTESVTVHEKQFHACDSSEMLTKTEMVLVQVSMYQNDSMHSLKSSRKHSYEVKQKKRQKCNTRHGRWAYPKTTKLNVLMNPTYYVGRQSYKVDVRNELCSVWLMSFDKIEDVTCMPQI